MLKIKDTTYLVVLLAALFTLAILTGCAPEKKTPGPAGPQGAQGVPGTPATLPAYAITAIVDPCGDASGIVDEVLLIFANGQVLVSFSQNAAGDNTRLSLLAPGSYITTDGSSCHFSVNSAGDIYNEYY